MLGKVHLGDLREGRIYLPVGKGMFQREAAVDSQKFFARNDRRQIVLLHANQSQRKIIESFEALLARVAGRRIKLEQRFVVWCGLDWSIVSIHAYDIHQFEECALDQSYCVSHQRYEFHHSMERVEYFPHKGLHFRSLAPTLLDYSKK